MKKIIHSIALIKLHPADCMLMQYRNIIPPLLPSQPTVKPDTENLPVQRDSHTV